MRTRAYLPILIVLALGFASLACAVSSEDENIAATEIDLPTPAPSPAPPEPTPTPGEAIIRESPRACPGVPAHPPGHRDKDRLRRPPPTRNARHRLRRC